MDRVARGSSILALRLAQGTVAWLKAGKGVGDFLIRLGFLLVPLWVLYSLVMATRALLWVVAAVWCIAAWRAAEPAKNPTTPPPGPPTPPRREEAGQESRGADTPMGEWPAGSSRGPTPTTPTGRTRESSRTRR